MIIPYPNLYLSFDFLSKLPISSTDFIKLASHAEVLAESVVPVYTFLYPVNQSAHLPTSSALSPSSYDPVAWTTAYIPYSLGKRDKKDLQHQEHSVQSKQNRCKCYYYRSYKNQIKNQVNHAITLPFQTTTPTNLSPNFFFSMVSLWLQYNNFEVP